MTALNTIHHWIFDMDGTLTLAKHDFPYMRRQLGMPEGELDILAFLTTQPADKVEQANTWLNQYGRECAEQAQAANGAIALVEYLHQQGKKLAILTRNEQELARITLESIGLLPYFEPHVILGRDDAPAKPNPAGIHHILQHWQASTDNSIMVGDYVYDVQTGRNAGTHTLLIRQEGNDWADLTDHHFPDCTTLLQHLQSSNHADGLTGR